MKKYIIMIVLAMFVSIKANAFEPKNLYFGGSLGYSDLKHTLKDEDGSAITNLDLSNMSFSIFSGYDITRNFALEFGFNYILPGENTEEEYDAFWQDDNKYTYDNSAYSFYLDGIYKHYINENFSVSGSLGLGYLMYKTEVSFSYYERTTGNSYDVGKFMDFTTNTLIYRLGVAGDYHINQQHSVGLKINYNTTISKPTYKSKHEDGTDTSKGDGALTDLVFGVVYKFSL